MSGLRQLALITVFAMAGMSSAVEYQSHHLRLPENLFAWSGMSAKAAPAPVVASARLIALASQPAMPPKPSAAPMKPSAPQPPPAPSVLPESAVPSPDPAITAENARAVGERLRDSVPAEIFPYFDVFIYVSKAADGAWAQHLYMFDKDANGDFVFEQGFPVSTGRELHEKYFTSTPTGMFELDPNRFDRVHYSHTWHGAAMPWAMFLDYTIHGHLTGIAMHSAAGHAFELGHRASGGCVRLPPEKAEELFNRFQATERGLVPVFQFDDARGTTMTDGSIVRDASGNVQLQDGYKVLLIIENYPGGAPIVATLS